MRALPFALVLAAFALGLALPPLALAYGSAVADAAGMVAYTFCM